MWKPVKTETKTRSWRSQELWNYITRNELLNSGKRADVVEQQVTEMQSVHPKERQVVLRLPDRGHCIDCVLDFCTSYVFQRLQRRECWKQATTLDSKTTQDKGENNPRLSCVVWWPVVGLGPKLCWRPRSRTWRVVTRKNESLWKECVWVCEIHGRSEGHRQNIPALLTRQRRGT